MCSIKKVAFASKTIEKRRSNSPHFPAQATSQPLLNKLE